MPCTQQRKCWRRHPSEHAEQYLIRRSAWSATWTTSATSSEGERGTPVYIRDVAEVRIGTEVRYGAMIKNGYTEAVGGVVLMTSGGNAKEIVSRVKERVAEINRKHMIPGGLQIMPYYDRSQLVDAAIHTVTEVLAEGIVFVVVVLFLFLGDLRSSLIVSANSSDAAAHLPHHEPDWSLGKSHVAGRPCHRDRPDGRRLGRGRRKRLCKLSHARHADPEMTAQKAASWFLRQSEVATPVLFGVTIIILVFLPLMTLEGMEGKMFAPLAYTIAIALGISLVLSLTLSPVLSSYLLKGGSKRIRGLVRLLRRPYDAHARLGAATHNVKSSGPSSFSSFFALCLFPFLGTAFIPEMQEGTLSPNADRVPNISLDESAQDGEGDAAASCCRFPA